MRDATKMMVLVLVPLLGFMITPTIDALTTFGKTNPQTQNQSPPVQPTPGGRSRTCKSDAGCAGILNTTCIADTDGKTRCLCGDLSSPVNGACTNTFKAVRFPCNNDAECGPYAQCVQKNNTMSGKRCECREDAVEVNRICSGSSPILRISMTILLITSGKFILL